LTVFGGKKTHPTFDPSPEILILSVSGFTWYLMYRIISLSRLTYAPRIFPGILSKWYKLLISSRHWETRYFRDSPSQNNFLSFFFRQILVWRFAGRRIEIDFNSLPIKYILWWWWLIKIVCHVLYLSVVIYRM
jgi:hypothetical protein